VGLALHPTRVNSGWRGIRIGGARAVTLPVPAAGFRWTDEPWGPMLRCVPLESAARHGFTSRQLGLRPGGAAPVAWAGAAASVGCQVSHLARVRQVHGADVRVVRSPDEGGPAPEADAAITNATGVAVAVVAADCVPVLLADPRTGAVAAVHAGWRGTAADAVGAAVAAMTREFGVRADTLVAAIGPSIGVCCYEVGEELRTAFSAAGHAAGDLAAWFVRRPGGRLRLDLWRANADLLARAGVPGGQVHVAGLCTKTHVQVLESFRVDGARAGRMAAIIVAP
jgi:YfiH family protein